MIHIACVSISGITPELYETLYAKATEQQKEKADRCRHKEDRMRCVVTGALVRYAAESVLSEPNFEVTCSSFGKPYLKKEANFYYNLSHSGAWTVIAYGSSEVGIDIERMLMNTQREEIVSRYFTADEQEYILNGADARRSQRFYQIWTAKESYLKYVGTGLSRPLNSFSVLADEKKLGVRFDTCIWEKEYCMTLCSTEEKSTIQVLRAEQLTGESM
ncbi:MAG: 4'-phosphopantetheinyl transferase superfamily protein [Lachnospiraceae bacterium]|nr:4'-phosphopantetheinyl transferase superfamily protein [Lachnospiraceae bacterium]